MRYTTFSKHIVYVLSSLSTSEHLMIIGLPTPATHVLSVPDAANGSTLSQKSGSKGTIVYTSTPATEIYIGFMDIGVQQFFRRCLATVLIR